MLLKAEDLPVTEIAKPHMDPERAGDTARFILEHLYGEKAPSAQKLEGQIAAFDGDVMVAVGALGETGVPGRARLRDVVVREGYKRSGLGTKIVSKIEAMATEAGAKEISCVSASTSVAFYRKLGYTADEVELDCVKILDRSKLPDEEVAA